MTKVRLQPDCGQKLVYNSSSLRSCSCAEFILSFPLLPSFCLIFLRWFLPLIYFSLVLPISRDWVTVIICLNSHLQVSLFSVHFLTYNWLSLPEGSLTQESGALLSVTMAARSANQTSLSKQLGLGTETPGTGSPVSCPSCTFGKRFFSCTTWAVVTICTRLSG